jgi:rhodanese-related sulfurtransferase
MRSGTLIIVGILLLAAIGYAAYDYAHNSRFRITAAEAKELLRQKQFNMILDVRTNIERETLGFYPNSIHIPAASIDSIMPTLYPDRNAQILIYCNTGQRARRAADVLHKLGYKKVFYIAESHHSLF